MPFSGRLRLAERAKLRASIGREARLAVGSDTDPQGRAAGDAFGGPDAERFDVDLYRLAADADLSDCAVYHAIPVLKAANNGFSPIRGRYS